MAQLSYTQIYALARNAGFTSDQAVVMTALTVPESGRDPGALNPNDNGGRQSSFGLWQISTGTHTPPAPDWNDPFTNARLARQKFLSQGFGAWGAYNTGKYKASLDQARAARNFFEVAGVGNEKQRLRDILDTVKGKNLGQRIGDQAKNLPGDIAGSLGLNLPDWLTEVENYGYTIIFALLGLGVVGLGVYQTFKPQIKAAQNRTAELAGAAAKGAAL